MEDFKDLFSQLTGNTEPYYFDGLIAVTFNGQSVILDFDCDPDLFDGIDLEDNLTDLKGIPTEKGLYKCKFRYDSFRCNSYDDPEEWDVNVSIQDIEKIEL